MWQLKFQECRAIDHRSDSVSAVGVTGGRSLTGVIAGASAVGVKPIGVVKDIDFVSQHSNHRSDHIQPTRVPVVDAILLWDWPSKATIVWIGGLLDH